MKLLNANNENAIPRARGLLKTDKGFLAITFREAKKFKRQDRAEQWLAKQGYNPDGTRTNFME